jgi:hypothetical protein
LCNLRYSTGVFLERLRNTTRNLVKMVSVSAEIRTMHLQNTRPCDYRLSKMCSVIVTLRSKFSHRVLSKEFHWLYHDISTSCGDSLYLFKWHKKPFAQKRGFSERNLCNFELDVKRGNAVKEGQVYSKFPYTLRHNIYS